jgi:hypothetical protein
VSEELTQERLKELLHYDPETGDFIWHPQPAGTIVMVRGESRWRVAVDRKIYFCSRLAWLYMTGQWPDGMVDHIDNDSLNDSWENLRLATNSQNQANSKVRSKSGLKGVYSAGRRFQSHITVNGVHHYLGIFDTPEEAAEAYKRAATEFFGEFARYD